MKYFFLLLFSLSTISVFAQKNKKENTDKKDIPTIKVRGKDKTNSSNAIIQTMVRYDPAADFPRFPGCEVESNDLRTRNICSEELFQKYLFENLKWPKTKEPIEGLIVGSIIVDTSGNVSSPKITKSLYQPYDEEVLRVIQKMIDDNVKWIPAQRGSTNVVSEFRFPVEINP